MECRDNVVYPLSSIFDSQFSPTHAPSPDPDSSRADCHERAGIWDRAGLGIILVAAGIAMVAALLTVKTAMECHSALQCAHYDVPFAPSLLRAVVVWYWWAAVAFVLWALGKYSLKPLLFSKSALAMQVVAGCVLAFTHMGLLRLTMLSLGAYWPSWGQYFQPLGRLSGERFSLDIVFRNDEVWFFKVLGRDLIEADELLDFDSVLRGDAEVGDLGGLDEDVLALAVFVTFYDLIFLHWRGGFVGRLFERGREDLLVTDTLASGAADLVEADLALGFGGDEEFDAEGDERDLDMTGPVWTCHGEPRRTYNLITNH